MKARVTVRTNIDRLVGGATEETIIARVGEGIVTTIGSAESHNLVLENPDSISKRVLEKGLDAGTAFEILSIDIADIDVGDNIGANLQAAQAEADTRVARAKAEERRAFAVAMEQENARGRPGEPRQGRSWPRPRSRWRSPRPSARGTSASPTTTTSATSRPTPRCGPSIAGTGTNARREQINSSGPREPRRVASHRGEAASSAPDSASPSSISRLASSVSSLALFRSRIEALSMQDAETLIKIIIPVVLLIFWALSNVLNRENKQAAAKERTAARRTGRPATYPPPRPPERRRPPAPAPPPRYVPSNEEVMIIRAEPNRRPEPGPAPRRPRRGTRAEAVRARTLRPDAPSRPTQRGAANSSAATSRPT